MSQHTPGPWTVNQKADNTGRKVIHDPVGRLVAIVGHAGDARLIAKAPEIYRILKSLAGGKVGVVNPLRDWIDRARALLAKIEETP